MVDLREFTVLWNTGTSAVGASTFHTTMATTPDVAGGAWWGFMNNIKEELVAGATGRISPVCRIIDQVTGQLVGEETFVPDPSPTAAGTGVLVPQASQVLVRWSTDTFLNGRKIRGRMFIPCLSASKVTAGELAPASQTEFADAANTFRGSLALVVWSRPKASGPGGAHGVVTGASVWNELATQRRRRRA